MRFNMDPDITDYEGTLEALKKNFEDNYEINRAPFGLYLHYFWFYKSDGTISSDHISFVKDFFTYTSSFPSVIFSNEPNVIKWVK